MTKSGHKKMKNVLLFNTAVGSLNTGDYIINESGKEQLLSLLNGMFVVEYATHLPVSHFYQNNRFSMRIRYTDNSDYKFILGTNLLTYDNFHPWPNWNVNIFNYRPYKGVVLIGVGSAPNAPKINGYTKYLYKKILSRDYIHSTRDEKTKELLESIGVKAINTGCVTLWGLTSEKCRQIPTTKSDRVVFTLTDYARDEVNDQRLVDILKCNYKNIYFWPQGSGDYEYIHRLGVEGIEIISPQLEAYRELLKRGGIDFVGTRLHAGIFAMQHSVRALIIIVDNRARDMQQSYNINAIERGDLDQLELKINSEFITKVQIDEEKIKVWKRQFVTAAAENVLRNGLPEEKTE